MHIKGIVLLFCVKSGFNIHSVSLQISMALVCVWSWRAWQPTEG